MLKDEFYSFLKVWTEVAEVSQFSRASSTCLLTNNFLIDQNVSYKNVHIKEHRPAKIFLSNLS